MAGSNFGLLGIAPFAAAIKRKVFFSFHYDDIMRVNNVRNAWKIDHPDTRTWQVLRPSHSTRLADYGA